MHERYKRLLTDTGVFAISNFGSKALTFLLIPLYTSVLSTEEYGTAEILTTTVNLIYPILTLSIYDATLRFAIDTNYDNKIVLSNSILFTGFGTAPLLLLTPFVYDCNVIFFQYWWYFLGIYITSSLQMCLSNYIKGCNKTKLIAIQGIIYTLSFLISNVILLLFLSVGLTGYFVSMIAANTISCIYMVWSSECYKELRCFKIKMEIIREMLIYSAPLVPSVIAWWINSSVDKYMLMGLIGVGANGLYGIAHKIPTILSSFTSLFSQAWRISAISTYDEKDKLLYYAKVYRMYFVTCLYGCFFLTFSSQFIAMLLFKAEYYQAWILIPPLVISALFEAYSGFFASIYAAARKTKLLSISTCVGAGINILLNYILIINIGVIGAPIATMASFMFVWFIRLRVLNSFMPINLNLRKQIATLLVVVISGMYLSFQGPFKYIDGVLAFAVITIINKNDIKLLLRFMDDAAIKIKHKFLGGQGNG